MRLIFIGCAARSCNSHKCVSGKCTSLDCPSGCQKLQFTWVCEWQEMTLRGAGLGGMAATRTGECVARILALNHTIPLHCNMCGRVRSRDRRMSEKTT